MGFQIFEPQFQLKDLFVEPFGFASKLHPLQLQNEQPEVLDFGVA